MSMELGSSIVFTEPRHSWWSKQTTKEKKLIIACGILSVLLFVFFVCTIALGSKKESKPNVVYVTDTTRALTDNTNAITESTPITEKPKTSTDTEATTLARTSGSATNEGTSGSATNEESSVTTEKMTPTTEETSTTEKMTTTEENLESVCRSEICKRTAFQMKMYMNKNINPCDNFYNYACGGFAAFQGENQTPLFNDTKLNLQVLDILQTSHPEEQTNIATWSTVQLFRKCVDHGKREDGDEGIEELVKLVLEVLDNNWPMFLDDKWNEDKFDWSQSVAKAMKVDPDFPVRLIIIPDPNNSTVFAPALTVVKPKYSWPENITEFVCTFVINCSAYFHSDDDAYKMKYLEKDNSFYSGDQKIWKYEKLPYLLRSDAGGNVKKFNMEELQKELKEVNWTAFFSTLLEENVTKDFQIILELEQIRNFVKDIEDDKRFFANKIAAYLIIQWGPLYSPLLRKNWKSDPELTLENVCFDFVNKYLGFAVGKLYMDKNLPASRIHEIAEDVSKVKEGFRELVVHSEWMNEETKAKALKKVDKMVSVIASPQWALNEDSLDKHYEVLRTVKQLPFIDGSRLAAENLFKQNILQRKSAFEKNNIWLRPTPLEMNAYYYLPYNSMYFPLGFLQFPYFVSGRPRSVTFGSFGYISGHEITHGFDSEGKNYDENGHQNYWWDPDSDRKYNSSADCFINQYAAIIDEATGLSLNGSLTLAENIADNGGIRAAFQAYKSAPKEAETKLIGFEEYSEDELFFISAAQTWCSSLNEDFIAYQIENDNHSPDRYRVLVPFSNFEEFSTAFNCAARSKMNPDDKCRIW